MRKDVFVKLFFCIILIGIIGLNFTPTFVKSEENFPSQRYGHVMVYDPVHYQIVLFGGGGDDIQDLETTWLFSSQSQTWTPLANITSPEARFHPRMVYNSISGKIILFGGKSIITTNFLNDTWEFDLATNEWTELHPTTAPSPRAAPAMYFDPIYNEIILYGGAEPVDISYETWIFNCTTNNWYQINPSINPGQRYGHSFEYDENLHVGVLFGGRKADLMAETWFFNRSSLTWMKQTTSNTPIRRYFTGFVYNPNEQNFIMFGGDNEETSSRVLADTWNFDPTQNNWAEIEPTVSPPPRNRHAMVFDSYLNRVMIFGGYGNPTSLIGDFWLYDPVSMTWTEGYSLPSETSNTISYLWIVLGSVSFVGLTYLKKRLGRD